MLKYSGRPNARNGVGEAKSLRVGAPADQYQGEVCHRGPWHYTLGWQLNLNQIRRRNRSATPRDRSSRGSTLTCRGQWSTTPCRCESTPPSCHWARPKQFVRWYNGQPSGSRQPRPCASLARSTGAVTRSASTSDATISRFTARPLSRRLSPSSYGERCGNSLQTSLGMLHIRCC